MRKLAFFVEGLTEQIFIKNLFVEIAGIKNITIEETSYTGKKGDTSLLKVLANSKTNNTKYYILIVDCQADNKVQSAIIDNHPSLVKENYSKVLGLKDIYPKTYSDLPLLEKGAKYGVPTKIPTDVLLAVAEVEAWFLAEHFHFQKIDSRLTLKTIKANFGHDLNTVDVEKILHPALELDNIYKHVGKRYKKQKNNLSRTIAALDFNNLYFNLPNRVVYLKKLITHIDSFLV